MQACPLHAPWTMLNPDQRPPMHPPPQGPCSPSLLACTDSRREERRGTQCMCTRATNGMRPSSTSRATPRCGRGSMARVALRSALMYFRGVF